MGGEESIELDNGLVPVAKGIVERAATPAIDRVHVRALLHQKLHNLKKLLMQARENFEMKGKVRERKL